MRRIRNSGMNEEEFCNGIYSEVQAKGVTGWYVRKSHKALESSFSSAPNLDILEVGANLGEHLDFVDASFRKYVLTDYRDTGFISKDQKVVFKKADVHKLPFEDREFDRVISTCLLHHLDKPIDALFEMRRVVRPGGTVSISLPCDPGMLYRASKSIGPSREWKKQNLGDPKYFHYTQHRNHYPALLAYIKEVFRNDDVSVKNWPLPIQSWNLNLFSVIQIEKKK